MVHSNAAASRRRGPEPEGPLAASAGNGGKTRDAHAAAAGALDVVGRRLASCTRRPPRADARNRRTARRQPGTPSARRPPRESRMSGTRPTVGPAVNTDYATASTTEPTFTVLAPAVGRPCRASSGCNAQLTNTHDSAADVRQTLTNASDASNDIITGCPNRWRCSTGVVSPVFLVIFCRPVRRHGLLLHGLRAPGMNAPPSS